MNPCGGGYYYGSGYSNCNTGDIIIPPVVIVPPINQNTCPTQTQCQTSCPQIDCCWSGMSMCNPMMGMYPMIGSMGMPTYPMQPPMMPSMPGMMPGIPPMSPPGGGSMGYYY